MREPLLPTDPSTPVVSVLLVTFGAWEWTERCLQALAETTDVDYELICVDNASPDQSLERLAAIPGVRLTRSSVNLGYGVAANLAAMHARAPYLLLLNTDAIVQPDWLPPLRSVLDDEDDVAAVAARLLHLDGRLQEAGSIVWSDGMTDCYGDGDSPENPEYRFMRDVDYASAACLLVRRSAFFDAGGFDPVYQPAYYEDTDLAMRWRSRRLRVVYQPFSTAVHKRWASSNDRAAAEYLVARHRPIFVERWRDLIGNRPARPAAVAPAALIALRDAECDVRILGVAESLEASAGQDVAGWLTQPRDEKANCRLTLLLLGHSGESERAEDLRARGVEVVGCSARRDLGNWLAHRQYHYTCVASSLATPSPVMQQVISTQPFATRVLVGNSADTVADADRWWDRAETVPGTIARS